MVHLSVLILCLLGAVLCSSSCGRRPGITVTPRGDHYVLLVHGLCRSGRSFDSLARRLQAEGHSTAVLDYPSRTAPISELTAQHLAPAIAHCRAAGARRIDIVTHSMGGILVRAHLEHAEVPELGRVVMLAPPNQGSEVIDRIGHWRLVTWLNGPAGAQLGTDAGSVPNSLGPVDFDCAVIAGKRSINLINSWAFIPGADDGKVSIERTKVLGMRDHLVISATHPGIMNNVQAQEAVVRYLDHGRFD